MAADVSELLGHGGYRLSVSGFAFHAFIIPDRQYDNLDFNAGRRIFEGGCQAEVGVASAMAASAAVELMGGTPRKCTFAASTVLMNMLGLVCDPVGGLVEYPCQNRNAAGVANAIIAAEMALAGIPQLIPLDEMIQTMFTVGKKLPAELRETAMGGCATTPSACEACHIY